MKSPGGGATKYPARRRYVSTVRKNKGFLFPRPLLYIGLRGLIKIPRGQEASTASPSNSLQGLRTIPTTYRQFHIRSLQCLLQSAQFPAHFSVGLLRYSVISRSSRPGMKQAFGGTCCSNSAIYSTAFTPVFCLGAAFTVASSPIGSRLYNGFQYAPVLSVAAISPVASCSHLVSSLISLPLPPLLPAAFFRQTIMHVDSTATLIDSFHHVRFPFLFSWRTL